MRFHVRRPLTILAAALIVTSACAQLPDGAGLGAADSTNGTAPSDGGDGGEGGESGSDPSPDRGPQDPAIDERLRSFTSWDPPVHISIDEREISDKSFQSNGNNVVCSVSGTREISPAPFDEFAAFAFSGSLTPGLLVEGNGVLDGDLRPVPVPRAPLTLQMDLASANPTVAIDNPTSSALTEGVADLKSDADARLTGIDIVPAQIDFLLEETSSYEEALFQLGVSARYDSPVSGLSAKFSSQFDQQETKAKHSVTMRLLQPMFTIGVDLSEIGSPGQYLRADANAADLERLVGDNKLGADNPPVLIDSITYGRSVYVVVSSTEVDSSKELRVAVNGAYGGFSGSADVAAKNRAIVKAAEVEVNAYGGDQDVATAALKSGEIKDFLQAVNTSNAIPLTFTMRTLDGNMIAVTDQATVQDIGCTRTPIPVEAARTDWAIEIKTGPAWVDVWVDGTYIQRVERNSTFTTVPLTAYINEGKSNKVEVEVWPDTCFANPNAIIYLKIDGVRTQGRKQDGASCAWKSTWTVNDANNQVTYPSNWSTRP